MKIGTYTGSDGNTKTGVVVAKSGSAAVLDLAAAASAFGSAQALSSGLDGIVKSGKRYLGDIAIVTDRALTEGEEKWFSPLTQTKWLVPIRSTLCLCAGRNFKKHLEEAKQLWAARSGATDQRDIPTGFLKLSHNLVPHEATVKRPPDVVQMDYEVEVAAVLGDAVERVSEEKALDHVFGYTIFNDLTAREWQFKEMENRMVLVGKNFPGAGPVGPWIMTADEIPDPSVLELELRVNGKIRQKPTKCTDMIYSFPRLISFWSRLQLSPGDMICSGTPEGIAASHKPDPFEWYLRPGDVVETEVRPIGLLKTTIA